jgi:glycogen operon protein
VRDSAGKVPYSVVTDHGIRPINRPLVPWAKTIVYEAHVKGLTAFNHEIPEPERGSYKALGHPSTIAHLKSIGVTALELLPIAQSITEPVIHSRGRKNHWGYNSLLFTAPHKEYASTADPIAELQWSVDQLHAAGIEVILVGDSLGMVCQGLSSTVGVTTIQRSGTWKKLSNSCLWKKRPPISGPWKCVNN